MENCDREQALGSTAPASTAGLGAAGGDTTERLGSAGNVNPNCSGLPSTFVACIPRQDGTFLCIHRPIDRELGDSTPNSAPVDGGLSTAQVLDGPSVVKVIHDGENCGAEHGPDCFRTSPWLEECNERTDGRHDCFHQS